MYEMSGQLHDKVLLEFYGIVVYEIYGINFKLRQVEFEIVCSARRELDIR